MKYITTSNEPTPRMFSEDMLSKYTIYEDHMLMDWVNIKTHQNPRRKMDWISIEDHTPKKGQYLVRFSIQAESWHPKDRIILHAEGGFDPSIGWTIENRFIRLPLGYLGEQMRISHWMPLPNLQETNELD